MMVHAKLRYNALTQGIRTIKTFTEYKNCYGYQFIQKRKKKTQEAALNIDTTVIK